MSYVFTDEQILGTLAEVVRENPDKVYKIPESMRFTSDDRSCFYVHKNEDGTKSPGCIVGQVLHRLGVPLKDFKRAEGLGSNFAMSMLGITGVGQETAGLLRKVQYYQDCGRSWSDALQRALKEMENDYGATVSLPVAA
ncbi:hypothetical protein [Streptomyces sp. PsTaAH-124]|uniref:hypothetical protein n=1 Tax=Streptomyces sp. PsTaAH-124 TaxID=1157638 RepID=UPI0003829DA8|nr:hypothetical protein [Streptomyces sp. PsTaAH-124]